MISPRAMGLGMAVSGIYVIARFPERDWKKARADIGLDTTEYEDMHGELETPILLHAAPDLLCEVSSPPTTWPRTGVTS